MSVEGPEARILADQMSEELTGRRVVSCQVREVARLQTLGFVNRDLADFQRPAGATVEAVRARGATIRLTMTNATNLVVAPEYGGLRSASHRSRRPAGQVPSGARPR
jgi:hypothetical protein